ncbi:unnamed protein product [Notodromas monacha]|uniref:Selenoprotein M n=1 Tax=Notodromas monacha TaxID=399045 RepID=A0A7R9GDS0_9CRUS|nr:unnamed protein product [Notodromas monacha]CAG0918998.1 unnamed protein product [Notodromas monacha]
MPEVKAFIYDDIPIHNVEFKSIPGADPVIKLLDAEKNVLKEVQISDMSREKINALMQNFGFFKKSQPGEPVPSEKISGPYHVFSDDL